MAATRRGPAGAAGRGPPAEAKTFADLAVGFGTTTVYRYLREALDLLAAMTPTLQQAIEVASRKAGSSTNSGSTDS